MEPYAVIAILITLAAAFSYINHLYLRLPMIVGLMYIFLATVAIRFPDAFRAVSSGRGGGRAGGAPGSIDQHRDSGLGVAATGPGFCPWGGPDHYPGRDLRGPDHDPRGGGFFHPCSGTDHRPAGPGWAAGVA